MYGRAMVSTHQSVEEFDQALLVGRHVDLFNLHLGAAFRLSAGRVRARGPDAYACPAARS